tara:strand:- start:275 stop:547 length:273 start_codon:yes stop_codon:yes gene_type:complete
MAFKGTAGVSASGASMSKYDVEVEARLQKLEKAVAEIAAKCDSRASGGGADPRVDLLINWANSSEKLRAEMPRHVDPVTGDVTNYIDGLQ